MADSRIPVTIITGFLGAGKTTLLNNIIRKHPEKKFAIIENEFGEINIDGGLIVGANDNIFELSNGCICCSLNNDFIEVIDKLMNYPEPFTHLLIETTGIADPGTVVQSFINNATIQMQFRIDSVICLIDSVLVDNMLPSEPEIHKQLVLSDIILLNKTEQIPAEQLQMLQKKMEAINPSAIIHSTSHADISDINILDTWSYSGKGIEKSILSFRNIVYTPLNINNAKSSIVKKEETKQNHTIQSAGISIPGSFDPEKFNYWIDSFLFFNSKDIFRIKGILSFPGIPEKQIFQAVGSSYIVEKGSTWEDDFRFCKLVFIGRNFKKEDLEWALHRLIQTGTNLNPSPPFL